VEGPRRALRGGAAGEAPCGMAVLSAYPCVYLKHDEAMRGSTEGEHTVLRKRGEKVLHYCVGLREHSSSFLFPPSLTRLSGAVLIGTARPDSRSASAAGVICCPRPEVH
jgi:hypothetical protein